jgi:hypothetical protein
MTELTEQLKCRCGEVMDLGYAIAPGFSGNVIFVVPGERTSANPITAFKQGLEEVPANKAYRLHGWRCAKCGRVELAAIDPIPWDL